MPNIDGGHYFLTCLFPVRTDGVHRPDGGYTTHAHELRRELSLLPVAQQSAETEAAGMVSPFARCRRTHFLRLFVIDQPMFNGRDPTDPLKNVLKGDDLLAHKPFDRLSRHWLVLAADFDLRPDEADQGRDSWARALWTRSQAEMQAIFGHVESCDRVRTADDFAALFARCQVDTTMSFNDYWPGRPPLAGAGLKQLLALILGIAAMAGALCWLLWGPVHLLWAVPLGLALGVYGAFRKLDATGARSFPPAPDSDLPSLLKALWVQQWFARFAVEAQVMDDATLHESFGRFLAVVQPENLAESCTQPPGVIRSDWTVMPRPDLDQLKRAAP